MNGKMQAAENVLNRHYEYINWCRENGFDTDDDQERIEFITKSRAFDPIMADLLELCEDNDEMKAVIKDYFVE